MLRSSWLLYLSGTLVSGFDDFPLEAAARNNGTGESDFFAPNTAGAQGESFILIWLKKETEYVNSGSYQQQKKALAIVLTVGENLSQSPIGRSFLLIIIGLKDMLLHLIRKEKISGLDDKLYPIVAKYSVKDDGFLSQVGSGSTANQVQQTGMVDFVPDRAVIDATHRKRVKYEAGHRIWFSHLFIFFAWGIREGCGDPTEAYPKVLHDSKHWITC
ncbi:hypothetical protein Tco_1523482 [Tanacetum coccineum]